MLAQSGRDQTGGVTERDAPSDFVEAFRASMPQAYRNHYTQDEILEHAEVVWRRGASAVHVDLWTPRQAAGGKWICVVTDDRPGLLSMVCAAIAAHSLDILGARIYCRGRSGASNEAVDLFWVQPLRGAEPTAELDQEHLAAIRQSIEALLSGEADVGSLEKYSRPTARPISTPPPEVYFEVGTEDDDLLIVDADDRPGLLSSITSALFREGVGILFSEVLTFAGRARDGFKVAALDGSRLSENRKTTIVKRVTEAVRRMT